MKSDNKDKKKKKNSWVLLRHKIIRFLVWLPGFLLARFRCHAKVDVFPGDHKRQYLILYNHQTDYDQIFVGLAFRQPIYYLAMEDILSNGWISSFLRFAVAPIPIKKQTMDLRALQDCFQVVKEGGSLSIAPEGNRTYSGRPCYINPSIAKLARKIKLPIVLYRIEGGYGMQPRWSNVIRKGPVHCFVSRVIEPEEYKEMTNEELYVAIRDGLWDDEAKVDHPYYHKKSAEFLDRMAYVCQDCGFARFESKGDRIHCTSCGKEIRYLPSKELEGVGFRFPFRFAADWYEYQLDVMNRTDPADYIEKPMFRDSASLIRVILYQKKEILREQAQIALYGDRIVIDEGTPEELVLPFRDAPVTIIARNKLNIYHGDDVYQIKGDFHFNALKYLNLYNRWKNIDSGNPEETFLGI